MTTKMHARALELMLRQQAAQWPTSLDGRKRSAAVLDEFFDDAVMLMKPRTFAEIGAFEAAASRRVKAAHPECRVVAFEASSKVHAHHSGQVDYASLGVEYRNAAVAGHDGTIELHVGTAEVAGNAASLRPRLDGGPEETTTVPAVTLDTAIGDEPGSTILWIDVEGAVGEVLAAGQNTLPHVDLAKIEVEDREHWHGQALAVDVIARLLEFELYPVFRDVEYAGQYNIVFASERLLADRGFADALEAQLHDLASRREPSALRQSDRLRSIARPARRLAHRIISR